MREGGFNLGGEQSGHIILSDFSTTGDGLIAALQVLAELVRSGKPMSAARPPVRAGAAEAGERPLRAAASRWSTTTVKAAIAEAEQRLNGSGRVLVRASGTEPLIRIMAEGDDEKLVGQLVQGNRRRGAPGRGLTSTPAHPGEGRDPGKTRLQGRGSLSGRRAPQALSSRSHEDHEGSEEHEGANSEAQPPFVSFASFVIFV